MPNTLSDTMITHPAYSVEANVERDVGSEIRFLGTGRCKFISLIDGQVVDGKTGKIIKSGGLISKRVSKNMRIETYTRLPHPKSCTVTIYNSGTSLSVGSVNGLPLRSMLYNPRNKTSCRVDAISTLALTVVSTSTTTFSAEVGDVLLIGPPAIAAGSTTAIVQNGTDDLTFNIMQFSRYGCSADWVAEKVKELAGGARFQREKMYTTFSFLEKIERSCLWGDYTADYATKNTQTSATLSDEFPTTRGLIKMAANSYDLQGSTTLDKLVRALPENMGEYVNENQNLICYCSNKFYGVFLGLIEDKLQHIAKEGQMEKFGCKTKTLLTAGPTIEFATHDSFNVAGAENMLLIFDPNSVGYAHFEGLDMKPNNNIQTEATHGKIDELVCYYGMETKDAGKTITVVSNAF